MDTLTPLSAVDVAGRISGQDVVADLCSRIAAQLSRSCDLRPADSYARYAARVSIQLQLIDVDTVVAAAELAVGELQPDELTHHVALDAAVEPEEIQGSVAGSNLERAVDGSFPVVAPEPLPGPTDPRRYARRGDLPYGIKDKQ